MTDLITPPSLEIQIADIATRYKRAGGVGMQVLNLIGGQAESLVGRLPEPVQKGLGAATESALAVALETAGKSRALVPDQAGWLNTAVSTALGAAGGLGGLPSALAELPVTVTVLFRAIQGIAAEYGYDPDDPEIKAECLHVFASAGPLAQDDGANTSFLGTRVTMTGAALQGLIARVAPRLSTALGQKLAAQTVPVLGAVAGAATNYAYTSYYQEMAHVHFGLLRAAETHDVSRGSAVLMLSEAMQQ